MANATDTPPSSPNFSIYVTHGTIIAVKSLARRFSEEEIHIQASFKDGHYVLLNKADLLKKTAFDDDLPKNFTPDEFGLLVNRIKKECFSSAPLTMLCVDSNLGYPSETHIKAMEQFFQCVASVSPQILIPFSDTPESVENANAYLNGHVMAVDSGSVIKEYCLPASVIAKAASDRAGLAQCISTLLSKSESAYRSHSIFSSKHTEKLELDEIRRRASSNDTTLASNETSFSINSRLRSSKIDRSSSLDEVVSSPEKQKKQPEKTLWDEFLSCCFFRKKPKVVAEQTSEMKATEKNRTGY